MDSSSHVIRPGPLAAGPENSVWGRGVRPAAPKPHSPTIPLLALLVGRKFQEGGGMYLLSKASKSWWGCRCSPYAALPVRGGSSKGAPTQLPDSKSPKALPRLPCWLHGKESACQFRRRSLGWEDPLEKEMATYSKILAWETP